MPITPAQRHRMQAMAAAQAGAETARDEYGEPTGSAYQLMMAALYEHTKQLKALQSVEKKIEAKRTLLADYDAYVDGVLSADAGGEDRVITTVMVWSIDAGLYPRALAIASYVLRHGLKLPDQYQRNVPTLLADEISTAALAGRMTAAEQAFALPHTLALVGDADIPDQARAKLHKACGYAILGKQEGQPEPDIKTLAADQARAAQQHLQRALDLYAQVGVKKDLERLARRLKTEADADASTPPQADPAPGGGVGKGKAKPARA